MQELQKLCTNAGFRQGYISQQVNTPQDKIRNRYVDSTPTSEITLFTIWYIQPPHNVHTMVNVMIWNNRLTSYLFPANQPSNSWDYIDLENQSQGHWCIEGKVT